MSLGNVDQARSVGGVAVAFTENSTLWKHCADIALCVNVAVGKARGRVPVEEDGMLACRNQKGHTRSKTIPSQVNCHFTTILLRFVQANTFQTCIPWEGRLSRISVATDIDCRNEMKATK